MKKRLLTGLLALTMVVGLIAETNFLNTEVAAAQNEACSEETCIYSPDETASGDTTYTYMPESSSSFWSSFSNNYYYNNGLLNSRQKKIYKNLYKVCYGILTGSKNVSNFTTGVSNEGCSWAERIQVIRVFVYSNPQFYFLTDAYVAKDKIQLVVYPNFMNGSKRAKCTAQLKSRILSIYTEAKTEANASGYSSGSKEYNYALELSIAEQICEIAAHTDKTNDSYDYSAYNTLVKGSGNWMGYGKAFELLINGLDCSKMYAVPFNNSTRFWNAVYLNGTWYLVDCYFVDESNTFAGSENFNVSISTYGGVDPYSNIWKRSGKWYYPKCSSNYKNADKLFLPKATINGSSITIESQLPDYKAQYITWTTDGTDPISSDTRQYSDFKAPITGFIQTEACTIKTALYDSTCSRVLIFDNSISNLKAGSGTSSITLSWTKAKGATSYLVQRKKDGDSSWTTVCSAATATSYTDKNLSSKTLYHYAVTPKYASTKITGKGLTTYGDFTTGVAAVSGLKLKSAGDTAVAMTWTAGSDAEGYQIYRSASKDKGYSLAKTLTGDELTAATNGTTVSYTDTVSAGATYYYKVRGYYTNESAGNTNHLGYGDFSSIITAVMKPAKISTFTQSASSTTAMNFTWNKVTGATKYQIYRASSSTGNYSLLATVASNGKATLAKGVKGSCSLKSSTYTFKNTGLSTGKTYYYKVRAIRVVSKKSYYGSFSTVIAGVTRPGATSGLKWKTSDSSSVTLTWTKASGASGYYVYQSTDNKTFTKIATVMADGSATPAEGLTGSASLSGSTYSYQAGSLTADSDYYYKVVAFRAGTKAYTGTASSVISAKSGPAAVEISSALPNFTAEGTSEENSVTITWAPTFEAADKAPTGYLVYRSTDDQTYTKIATIAIADGEATAAGSGYSVSGSIVDGSYTFIDKNLNASETYYYRVYAYKKVGSRTLFSTLTATGALSAEAITPATVDAIVETEE